MAGQEFGAAVRHLRASTTPAAVGLPGGGRRVPGLRREELGELVALVDSGALHVEVTRRIPLSELPALHAEAAAGGIAGKVVVEPV